MWDLGPWPVIRPRPPALGAKSQPLDNQRSPQRHLFLFACFELVIHSHGSKSNPTQKGLQWKDLLLSPVILYSCIQLFIFPNLPQMNKNIYSYPNTINRRLDKETEGILFSHAMKSCTCDRIDRTWGRCAEWSVRQREANTVWYHLYVGS